MTFANLEKEFGQANCKFVGLSVDGLYSHIAWLRTIKEKIESKNEDIKCNDWFFCNRQLIKEKVLDTILKK
jgi:hypothetical protein